MGGTIGNLNAIKNGKRVSRLVVGELPSELRHVKREARRYRRALESATLDAHNEINTTHAHAIDTASAATIHAGICRWLLRERIGSMTTADILAASAAIVKAKQARDGAIRLLGLDRDRTDIWAEFDRTTDIVAPATPTASQDGASREDLPEDTDVDDAQDDAAGGTV